jgi:outer membrane biosynthesis protein TonB
VAFSLRNFIFRFALAEPKQVPEKPVEDDIIDNIEDSVDVEKSDNTNPLKKRKRSDSNADFQQPPPKSSEEASPPTKAKKDQKGAFRDSSKNTGSLQATSPHASRQCTTWLLLCCGFMQALSNKYLLK